MAADVDAATEFAADNPAIGERRKGDLADLFVDEFCSQNQARANRVSPGPLRLLI
ncbi:MAG: type II toxin-antitoxin system RelE/ParE family toxin [Candidatus Accumulibacter sp.]|nr:type II toxin-antitoxin system RelE/ParE family toxin [Accumulibacter sp.]MCM8627600.1 type II toxin-antitoxin system RelE/ParE family toxin [Accumulibacter sp.]